MRVRHSHNGRRGGKPASGTAATEPVDEEEREVGVGEDERDVGDGDEALDGTGDGTGDGAADAGRDCAGDAGLEPLDWLVLALW